MRKLMFIVVCLLTSVVIFAGGKEEAAKVKTLRVGVLAPLTGASARSGQEIKAAVEMAFEHVNYQIGDYRVELVWIDSQGDPAKATNAYAEAIERKGIEAGILNWHSSVAVACMDLAAQYKIPHFGALGVTSTINDKYLSDPKYAGYWTKIWPVPTKLSISLVECLDDAIDRGLWKPSQKTVAIYGEDTDWGRDAGKGYRKYFSEHGWQIVMEDYFVPTQTEFYPLMDKYKKANVAAIVGGTSTQTSIAAFLKQATEVGVEGLVFMEGLGYFGGWYELTGEASDYVLDQIPTMVTAKAKQWAADMKQKYGLDPGPVSGGIPYDAANYFIKICKRTLAEYGKLDRDTIHNVIVHEVITGELTYGKEDGALIMNNYRYNADTIPDPVVGKNDWYLPVIQYMNGEGRIVFPEDLKERDLQVKD